MFYFKQLVFETRGRNHEVQETYFDLRMQIWQNTNQNLQSEPPPASFCLFFLRFQASGPRAPRA